MFDKIRDFMKLSKTQAVIILCGFYIFLSLASNIASTKLIYLGSLVTDAGFIYYIIFTWRDLIHKQLGRKVAVTTIWVAAVLNILAVLYFQLVVGLPPESDWANAGGQTAWSFIFSLQLRLVLGSIIAFVISELIDTKIYEWWTKTIGKRRPQWMRVVASNTVSIIVDTAIFVLVVFTGVVGSAILWQLLITNILLKAIATIVSAWMIYLVPEKPLYTREN
jgi:queuosine precursor transporter